MNNEKIRCVNIKDGSVGFFVPSLVNGPDGQNWQASTGFRPEPIPGDMDAGPQTPAGDTPMKIVGDTVTDEVIIAGQLKNPPPDSNLDFSKPAPHENDIFPLEINTDETIPGEENSAQDVSTQAQPKKNAGGQDSRVRKSNARS